MKTYPLSIEKPIDDIYLSLVVPAYNEEKRIEIMLSQTIPYFNNLGFKYEIIIVNDGSRDNTYKFVKNLMDNKYEKTDIKLINYSKNAGKGFAVKSVINVLFREWN